jgi:phosphate transport system protein
MHTDHSYDDQLRELRNALLRMAGRVETMIADSVAALVHHDVDLAERTIASDAAVNRAEVETDSLCLQILAQRQPMASDLRFVTLSLKMVTDLERIGDLAVNICERAVDLAADPPRAPWIDVPNMAIIVQTMVHDAIDAFVDGDAAKAEAVIDRDDTIDALYVKVFKEVLTDMTTNNTNVEMVNQVNQGIHVQSVAKWLERMADHSTNLAEQVIFMVRGEDVRHRSSR